MYVSQSNTCKFIEALFTEILYFDLQRQISELHVQCTIVQMTRHFCGLHQSVLASQCNALSSP